VENAARFPPRAPLPTSSTDRNHFHINSKTEHTRVFPSGQKPESRFVHLIKMLKERFDKRTGFRVKPGMTVFSWPLQLEIRPAYWVARVLHAVIPALTVHWKARILWLSVGYSGLSV
jgi:hypothetical protein